MSVTNIVITGGPCAGKSTGLSKIEQELVERGYRVFVVPETATEVITGGIKPSEIGVFDFQSVIFSLQKEKERLFRKTAQKFVDKGEKCVILYDRGIMDAKSFMTDKEFTELCKSYKEKENIIRDNYDGVFHLVTAANGAEEFYTLENNLARTETAEQAREIDKKCIRAWTGHPHLRVIDNNCDFNQKIKNLLKEIYSLLGEPIPMEIERKYLIKMPDIDELNKKYDISENEIIQTYLNSQGDTERRVRMRGANDAYSYYYTEKRGTGLTRSEVEKKITQDEYVSYLMDADTSKHLIRKNRYCFVYKNNYIEMDIYPFWKNYAIVEVEISNENAQIELPPELEVIKEVTDDDAFKNHSLAVSNNIGGLN